MPRTIAAIGVLALGILVLAVSRATAAGVTVRETGLQLAGGVNPSSLVQYYAVHPYVGLTLWQRADRWFAERDVAARWLIEPWAAFVSDRHGKHRTDSFEIGVSPLFLRLTFGESPLRPYVEGGEGFVYTDLRKQDYGTRVQFTSQIGAGLVYRLRANLGLTFAVRFRHMSNAGLASSNPGINSVYGLIGATFD